MTVNMIGTIKNTETGETSEVLIQTESDLAVRIYVDGDWDGFEYSSPQAAKADMLLEMLASAPELSVTWDERIR